MELEKPNKGIASQVLDGYRVIGHGPRLTIVEMPMARTRLLVTDNLR